MTYRFRVMTTPLPLPFVLHDVPAALTAEPKPVRSPGTETEATANGYCGFRDCPHPHRFYQVGAEIVLAAVTEHADRMCHIECTQIESTGLC